MADARWSDRDGGIRLRTAHPQVFVTDLTRALAFYERQLGFRTVYAYGEPPFYGLVERDDAALNLRHVERPPIEPAWRDREQLLSAVIPVEGVARLYDEVARRGARIVQELRRQPWGAEDFVVADPDGNLICFGQSAAGPARSP